MRRAVLARLERLEAILAPMQVGKTCYGWLAALPADYSGGRHTVIVKQEPTNSPRFEWYEWEERQGPAPIDADDGVPTPHRAEAETRL
jgi:hypothetical protein